MSAFEKSKSDKIELIDGLIKAGQISAAQVEIEQLTKKQLNRQQLLELAVLSRRAGLTELVIRLLYKQVRELGEASDAELCEYAIALIRLGHYAEGGEILATLKESSTQILYTSFAHIYQWEYDSAVVNLKKYLGLKGISDYERLVAEVNLQAAELILNTQNQTTEKTLLHLLEKTKKENEHQSST